MPNPNSDVALLDVAAGWRPWREGAPDNLRDYMTTMRKAGPHGVTFHYVSTNTDVLGWIIERVSGTDFATLLSPGDLAAHGRGVRRLCHPRPAGGAADRRRPVRHDARPRPLRPAPPAAGHHERPAHRAGDPGSATSVPTATRRPGTAAISPPPCPTATTVRSGTPTSTTRTGPASASASTARASSSIPVAQRRDRQALDPPGAVDDKAFDDMGAASGRSPTRFPADAVTATATNFQDAPHSAWGFHHVRELLPTAPASGVARVRPGRCPPRGGRRRHSGPAWRRPHGNRRGARRPSYTSTASRCSIAARWCSKPTATACVRRTLTS